MECFIQLKEKTLNKLAVAIVLALAPVLNVGGIYLVYVLWYTSFYPLILMYLFWMFYVDRRAPTFGRQKKWTRWRSLWFFKRFTQYFPQTMIKTAPLPADDNYLLCLFPHGVFPTAPIAHFGPSTGQFYDLFPALDVSFHSIDAVFRMPLSRELALATGYASCSENALLHHLNKPKGHAAVLMPGGVAEGLICEPNHNRVLLKNRKGFVRVGLKAGTNLVPIYSFGENDLFYQNVQREGDFFYKAQQYFRKRSAPIYLAHGVGFFQNYFGFLPRQLPVHTVVGAPIKLPKLKTVTQRDVDHWHDRFVEELVKLFDSHKHKYVENPENTFLEIE